MLLVTAHGQALRYLVGVAESNDPDAFTAVSLLQRDAHGFCGTRTPAELPAAEQVLSDLVKRDRVCEPVTRSLLGCLPPCGEKPKRGVTWVCR